MNIKNRVLEALEARPPRGHKPDSLVRLETFYARMKEKGLIRRNEYAFPPLDTLGRAEHRHAPPGATLQSGRSQLERD